MLASPPVRAAGERVGGLAAAAICFCALFFGGGDSNAPIVWIGGLALVLAAALLLRPSGLSAPGALFLGSLFGLGVWVPFVVSSVAGLAFILLGVPWLRAAGRDARVSPVLAASARG